MMTAARVFLLVALVTCLATAQADTSAVFEVNKTFTDGNSAEVEVTLECNTGLPLSQSVNISPGSEVYFVVIDFESGELDCRATEDVPPGYRPEYDDGTVSDVECYFADVADGASEVCAITNFDDRAFFEVEKFWADGSTDPVWVHISCNSGLPLAQSFLLDPGSFVVFVVTDFPDGEMDCEVTETVPPGYDPSYDDGAIVSDISCYFADVNFGDEYRCEIINSPIVPPRATIMATKEYSDANLGEVEVQLTCNSGLPLAQSVNIAPGDEVHFVVIDFESGEMDCELTEIVPFGYSPEYDDGVVVSNASCSFTAIEDGDSLSCEILNTAFPFSRARFAVRRGVGGPIDDLLRVRLDCVTGTPISQTARLAPGATTTFVVAEFPGSLDCLVSEEPRSGVTPVYEGGEASPHGCVFVGLRPGASVFCSIIELDDRGDSDGDNALNADDNCPITPNPNQDDFDQDGLGDACDPDSDNDGVGNTADECPATEPSIALDPETGCSIAQLCPCEGPRGTGLPWSRHSAYVKCVKDEARDFESRGILTRDEARDIVAAARASSCGN